MKKSENAFSYFKGEWIFTREITSIEGEEIAVASGNAIFQSTSTTDELLYHEEGKLFNKISINQNSFFRDYYYRIDSNIISVYHACGPQHGEFYQSYKINSINNTMTHTSPHICGNDTYFGVYTLLDSESFCLTTKVIGPQKNYLIRTLFKRSYEV